MLRQAAVLDALARFHDASGLDAALLALTDDLRRRLGAERVALALAECGEDVRVGTLASISGQATIDPRAPETRLLAAAMEEACRRGAQLHFGSPEPGREVAVATRPSSVQPLPGGRAHRDLLAGRPRTAVVTTPLFHRGRAVGALLIEHAASSPPGPLRLLLMRELAVALAPTIADRRRAERTLRQHLRDALGESLRWLGAPRRLTLKLASATLAIALAAFALVPLEHRVVAAAELVPLELRTITAPVTGFVREVAVESGDTVRRGDPLLALDTRSLVLERDALLGELERLDAERRALRATGDRRGVAVLAARRERAAAELALVERRIALARVTAPDDARVLSGELSELVGAPVERGQRLMELAPDGAHTVRLLVDERDVGLVAVGQRGAVVLEARANERLPLTVTAVRPIAVAGDGRNRFRVEATLDAPRADLLPGQSGVARVDVGRASALSILTRRFVEWLDMLRWEWLG